MAALKFQSYEQLQREGRCPYCQEQGTRLPVNQQYDENFSVYSCSNKDCVVGGSSLSFASQFYVDRKFEGSGAGSLERIHQNMQGWSDG